MQLSVGDRVVYPRHGMGRIRRLENLDLVEGFERYYVIDIPDQGLTVRVPVRKVEELGVRPVMSTAMLAQVLDTLCGRPGLLAEDHRKRQEWVRERLETGRPLRIAEIVRDLTWHERRAHLTKADSALLAQGREILSAEIALVTDTPVADAKQTIDDAMKAVMDSEPGQLESE